MPALANHTPVALDDGADEGVRRDRVTPALGEAAGKIHQGILQHVFLSPIRTLTVGAGLRLVARRTFTGSTSEEARGLPDRGKTLLPGSPPVREFHPPPKVTQQAIPQKDHGSKETLRVFARSGFASSARFGPFRPSLVS